MELVESSISTLKRLINMQEYVWKWILSKRPSDTVNEYMYLIVDSIKLESVFSKTVLPCCLKAIYQLEVSQKLNLPVPAEISFELD